MSKNYQESMSLICKEITLALGGVKTSDVEALLEAILGAEKVFFVGVGRVFLALQAIAKRLSHLGIQTYLVGQITEPAIGNNDLLIVGSGSGESLFPVAIAKKAKSFQASVAHIGANPSGSMKEYADLFIRIPVSTKLGLPDEIPSLQPMTSLFEQSLFLLGDILALMIVSRKKLDMKSLWQHHANLE